MIRPALLVVLAVLALGTSGCGSESRSSPADSPRAARTLTDLHDIAQLQTAFTKASDRPRLIVLVSPT